MHCTSHNIDFATYPRTGVFWRGGLLHSVSGVSYWTLWAGIVGHLRPYANNGRFLMFNPRFFDAIQATAAGSGSEARADAGSSQLHALVRRGGPLRSTTAELSRVKRHKLPDAHWRPAGHQLHAIR
jgi:hypothetical protein